ncbi:hypothetical protein DDN98_13940 [Vibrio cholerae]|nr:hypothetical protein [Vibrio cholerae]EGR4298777.1 hypothetical protein [Vibrio cholerae]EKF9797532.1 hypothetical protein [Vibrio cholerae]
MRIKLGLVSALMVFGCASAYADWPESFELVSGPKLVQSDEFKKSLNELGTQPVNINFYYSKPLPDYEIGVVIRYISESDNLSGIEQAKVYTSWISDYQRSSEKDGITVMNVRPDSELTCSGKFESREKLNQCYYNIYPIVESRRNKEGAECATANAPLYDEKENIYGLASINACSLSMSASEIAKQILPTIQESQRSNYLSQVFKKL